MEVANSLRQVLPISFFSIDYSVLFLNSKIEKNNSQIIKWLYW
jgi:hypothetical protein